MENHICQKCKCFIRHYIKLGKGYVPLEFGHCVYPRIKNRECSTQACGKFALSKEFFPKVKENQEQTP